MAQNLYTSELWMNISFNNTYQVSSKGSIRRLAHIQKYIKNGKSINRKIRAKNIRPRKHTHGYLKVKIDRKDYYIHRLVADAFIGLSIGKEVNHKNSNRADNRLINLEVVTRKENNAHSYAFGNGYAGQIKRVPKISGTNCHFAKCTEKQVREIKKNYKAGMKPAQIIKRLNVSRSIVEKIVYGVTWKHIK